MSATEQVTIRPATLEDVSAVNVLIEASFVICKPAITRLAETDGTATGVPLYRLRGCGEERRMAIVLPNCEALAVFRMTKSI